MKYLSSWNPDCDRVYTAPPIITIIATRKPKYFCSNRNGKAKIIRILKCHDLTQCAIHFRPTDKYTRVGPTVFKHCWAKCPTEILSHINDSFTGKPKKIVSLASLVRTLRSTAYNVMCLIHRSVD